MNVASLLVSWAYLISVVLAYNHENCSTKLSGLESALYNEGRNLLNMESAFFPSLEQTSRFLRVEYVFTDGNNDDDCRVTFFWSVGSFLFIQPPSIFTLSSLHFNFPANSVDKVTLLLPNECRPLVYNNSNDMCSCKIRGITYLDMITRHLLDYAKVNSPQSVERNDKTTVRIVCGEELKKTYYENLGVLLFFVMTLVLPFGLLIVLALFVRSHRKQIEKKCTKSSNHGNVAGVILTGVFIMLYILSLDIIAVIRVFSNSHEFSEYNVQHSMNLIVVVITAALDFLASLYSITAWLLFVGWTCTYKNCHCLPQAKFTYCFRNILKCLFVPYLYCIFGYKKHDKFWMEEEGLNTENQKDTAKNIYAVRQIWALLALMIGPLFGIFSHICYILAAWLTEPHKTSSIFVFAIVILLYLFTLFRALYKSSDNYGDSSSTEGGTAGNRVVRFIESFFHCCIICCANYNCIHPKNLESVDIGEEYINDRQVLFRKSRTSQVYETENIIFSKARLLSTFIAGVIAVIPLALTVIGFTYIPIPALDLADYLRNVIEIGLVLFATLATHKIFSLKEPDMNLLIQKFIDSYEAQSKSHIKLSDNLFEACGEIAGEVCQTIYRSNGYPLSQHTQSSVDNNVKPAALKLE